MGLRVRLCLLLTACNRGGGLPGPSDGGVDSAAIDAASADQGAVDLFSCPDGQCVCGSACAVPTGPRGNACCGPAAGQVACFLCVCASPDTPIGTPTGERPISELRAGDIVLSLNHGALRPVPLLATRRVPAFRHVVVHILLDDGRILEISPGHPTADGRTLGDLSPGDYLGNVRIQSLSTVPYGFDATYDILPASDSGTYLAGGALIGSTLFR